MQLDVYLTPRALAADALKGKIVVVVDVLRACSTTVTALANGARAVVPVDDMGEAGRIAAAIGPETSLLGGERNGRPIDGYGVGNSPLEYTPELVAGKTIVLNTTNGTGAFVAARGAASAVAGCFRNVSRVVDFLRAKLPANGDMPHGAIVCAGQNGRVAREDVLCTGMILHHLWGGATPDGLDDGAHIALAQYRQEQKRLTRALFSCTHTQHLIALGYADDVAYCAEIDATPLLPRYEDSRITLDADDRTRAAEAVLSGATQTDESLAETARA